VNLLESVSIISPANEPRGQIVHALDGRYQPFRPAELVSAVRELAAGLDVNAIDYVLGFPEGGITPAFAFAHLVDRPLILSTRFVLEGPGVISFEEPHSGLGKTHYIRGLREGDRVVVIEDEVTTGRTLINAVRALRGAGVQIDAAGALLAVDDPAMWQSMKNEDISLVVTSRLPGVYRTLLGVEASP
jgi:adenine phosphoribosyltransferase